MGEYEIAKWIEEERKLLVEWHRIIAKQDQLLEQLIGISDTAPKKQLAELVVKKQLAEQTTSKAPVVKPSLE